MTTQAAEELKVLVHKRIESLRPKLLDLSRRNPLISIKLSPRSNSYVRVIDELPDILFFNLTNGQRMKFISLPSLDEDPADERADVFKRAFAEARRSDPEYLAKVDKLDKDAEDYSDVLRKAERALKDRLRAQLGYSPRPMKQDVNLVEHARNNDISPSYDLPEAGNSPDDGRHSDSCIQTLLLPEDLERKLSALNSKCSTWLQETGLNVLRGAFGFLEWSEKGNSETSFAPLILLQVRIEKKKTSDGAEFWASGLGEEGETNAVLSEKLKQEFDIELPAFPGGSIEEYLAQIAKLSPKSVTWRVRRQVAFGVFPSARMAMFHDLDTRATNFADNDIVRPLLGGNGTTEASPFADDYLVDTPEIEKAVPHIVMDADASQFSTLVDIANKKNLAVEGPPGSGKSQTIVNTIAAALAAGKKILFVAEKTAALEVVRARLDAIGLGEFLLPLQAQHSTRESVIQSLRDRFEMDAGKPVVGLTDKIASFKEVRAQLAEYISVITLPFEESGFTVHEIIGNSVATEEHLLPLPKSLQQSIFPSKRRISKGTIEDVKLRAELLEIAAREIKNSKSHWKGTGVTHLTPFDLEGIIDAAKELAARLDELHLCLSSGSEFGLTGREDAATFDQIIQLFESAENVPDRTLLKLVPKFAVSGVYRLLTEFIEDCDAFQVCASRVLPKFSVVPTEQTLEALAETEVLCRKHGIDQLHSDELAVSISKKRDAIDMAKRLHAQMEAFAAQIAGADQWRFSDIGHLRSIIADTERNCLYARRPDLASDPIALGVMRNLNSQGRSLFEERKALGQLFALNIAPEADELARWLATFKNAGTFAFLSSTYRRARAAYIGVSQGKWNRTSAIQNLARLVDWKTRERDFRLNSQAAVLYGLHFKGVDTDFALMDAVTEFCLTVREKFPRIEQKGVREFLLQSPVEVLLEVPELEAYPETFTLKALKEGIVRLETEAMSREADYQRLHGHTELFTPGEKPSAAQISELSASLKDYLARKQDIDNRSEVSALLGAVFAGSGTSIDRLKPIATLCEAVLAGPDPEMLASAVGSGRATDGIKCAQELKAALDVASRLEREFLNKTKLCSTSEMVCGTPSARAAALRAAAADPEGLAAHSVFASAKRECDEDLHGLIDNFAAATGTYEGLADALEALAFRSLARQAYSKHGGVLGKFNGAKLDELRGRLARLDKEIILSTRKDLRAKIKAQARPSYGRKLVTARIGRAAYRGGA